MSRTTKTLGTVAVLLTAGLAVAALPGCGGHGYHRSDPARVDRMITGRVNDALDDLKATPEQRQAILAAKDRLLARGQALRGDHQAVATEALALWEAPAFDRARALALIDARIDALRATAHEAVDAAAEVHATLTPEQRAQVTARLRKHLER